MRDSVFMLLLDVGLYMAFNQRLSTSELIGLTVATNVVLVALQDLRHD